MKTNHSQEVNFDFIATRLKEFRVKKGYSNYEHLAYEIGISRSQYGRYEKGANMKLSTLFKILEFLEVSVEEFFKGIDEYNS
ncbi:XRE family transcriptional regulator [Putridiphycobacter roseus]|uniref:XRE family transcriptional regulator n=1 Tax=Putridiphycobacter roseus TaxID=2219161 RepID=A0A2W1N4U9_9FLAO|nr:helix-turn-helix transcriptional regulator [Putridiphycobacter roseus]PZE18141.1 XRE family transcriptional regulator [Putridiphycobacter roseus]